ncbi:MAG: hypothetical protein ABIF40_04610 [archaeon]
MRDNDWLIKRLDQMWELLFPDVERLNFVRIRFKGKWKNKFGHIKRLRDKSTEIAINGLFSDERVPEYIIDTTIAHELVHYLHGFQSPYPQRYKHPHRGGVVNKELAKRGFGHLMKVEKEFVQKQWMPIFRSFRF